MIEKFKVTGMSCAACSSRVENAVSGVSGVQSCSVNLLTGDMTVEGDATREAVEAAVVRAGYGISSLSPGEKTVGEPQKKSESSEILIRLILSIIPVFVLMYLSMGHMVGLPLPAFLDKNPLANAILQLILSASVMVINSKFFKNGLLGLIRRAPNMDTLVSLGSFVSFAYSIYVLFAMSADAMSGAADIYSKLHSLYFESAAMILALITLGKLLEARAKGRTTNAIKSLIDMSPKTATVIVDGEERTVLASELAVGDVFVVKPGESIPTDAEVIDGESSVDESALTGESMPVAKGQGSRVYAATINKSGRLICRASEVGENTVLAGIIKMVSDATASKAPIAKLADKVSGVFVPFVMAVSLITLCGWLIATGDVGYAVSRAIAVLVISCPCALGLATPTAIMVGGGVGARRGILFKNATALEECGRIDTVVLDKTGTITKGEMSVTDTFIKEEKRELLLSVALSLEARSEHPIASAIVDYCEKEGATELPLSEFSVLEGRGVYAKTDEKAVYAVSLSYADELHSVDGETHARAEEMAHGGRTPILVIYDGECLGAFGVSDTVKEDAAEGIRALKTAGYKVVMLTGDSPEVACVVAEEVGIDTVRAGVLPSGKEGCIRELMSSGRVMMVGDGINDAPALTRANVGAAIGAGTDIAIESADVVLMGGGIAEVSHALGIGRATLRNIKQNLFWAFLYNCIGIPMAAGLFGFALPPMFGAAAMSFSSFSVVTNALRLNFWRPKKAKGLATSDINIIKAEEIKMLTKEIKVEGMMCPHCEARVKKVLEELDGVETAAPSHTEKKVTLTLSKDVPDELIKKTVEDAGYSVV